MSLPDRLFEQAAASTAPEPQSWLWLLELTGGRVVQMTCSPDAERAHVERFARARHGAALLRVVPVPSAVRPLRAAEIKWALAGHGLVPVEAMPPQRWLARVAWLLDCSPRQLEASGKLTGEDGGECSAAAPHLAAELIRSSGWQLQPERDPGTPTDQVPPPALPSDSATWRAARDSYHGHLASCTTCIAHRLHNPTHCEVGAALRRAYDAAK